MDLSKLAIPELAARSRVKRRGHYILSPKRGTKKWLHTPTFLDGEQYNRWPLIVEEIASRMAEEVKDWPGKVRAVVGPERGATVLAHCVARILSAELRYNVHAISVQKKDTNGGYTMHPRDRELIENGECIAIDDVATTGTALIRTSGIIVAAGGSVIGGAVSWDRSSELTASILNLKRLAVLCREHVPWFTDEECAERGPCHHGEAINTDLGHGAAYLAEQRREKERRRARA